MDALGDDDIVLSEKKPTEAKLYGPTDISGSLLANLIFVVTGQFSNITRENLIKFITEKGGKVTGGVSGKTNYLVAGHSLEDGRSVQEGGKYKQAKSKAIKILNEDEFDDFVKRLAGLPNF